ncbi:MAG: hypothetical protein ACRECC_06945 [Pseudolabrys sp.]
MLARVEAVFLEAAGRRLDIISQANDRAGWNLKGIEIHEPSAARAVDRLSFTAATWNTLRNEGTGVYLFYPNSIKLNKRSENYVEEGRRQKIHKGYKCANRTPWWRVPILAEPDLIFTYMNHHMPRLINNDARVQITNSVYGVSLARNRKTIGKAILPILFFNSISALSSEVEGRSYGGGLLKHEPREADRILVPSLSFAANLAEEVTTMKQIYEHSHQPEYA